MVRALRGLGGMKLFTSPTPSPRSPSAPILRTLVVAFWVAFGVGCGGGASMMQPATTSHDIAPAAAETSCAGDVCFTYAER